MSSSTTRRQIMVGVAKKVNTKRIELKNILELEMGDLSDWLNVKGLGQGR